MNKTVNKADLIATISQKLDLYKSDVDRIVSELIDAIVTEVKEGNQVKLLGLGTFMRVHKAARQGVNPATGKELTIAEKKVPKFKVSKTFKQAVDFA